CRRLAGMPKPTVAVVNGVAAGAGVSLALACDLRLASSDARWRLAFSGIALIPDAGSTWHLPRLVGLSRALELALLGDWVEADQALAFGLVNRVWPADDLRREAEAAVGAPAAGRTLALGRAKALLRGPLQVGLDEALAGEAAAQVASGQTKDHAEGVAAFLEKRPPTFQGAWGLGGVGGGGSPRRVRGRSWHDGSRSTVHQRPIHGRGQRRDLRDHRPLHRPGP